MLVGVNQGFVVASAMAGFDGHRGWVNYLAVTPQRQKEGLGAAMLNEVERRLAQLGCPKLNLQVRSTNLAVVAIYQRMGYCVDEVENLGKRLPSF